MSRSEAVDQADIDAVSSEIRRLEADVDRLQSRIRQLSLAVIVTTRARNLVKVQDAFVTMFKTRLYETPNLLNVPMYSDDWAGPGAVSFALRHGDAATRVCDTARDAIATADTLHSQLTGAATAFDAAITRMQGRIEQLQADISTKNGQILMKTQHRNNLRSQIGGS